MNTVTIAGRLGKDPETRTTPSGQKLTTFPVATNIYRGGKEETIWWRVTIWGDRFDRMLQYMNKGKGIMVVGQISRAPEVWTDQSGQARASSLDLTADALYFSPFGEKNSDQTQQAGAGSQFQTPQQQPAASQYDGATPAPQSAESASAQQYAYAGQPQQPTAGPSMGFGTNPSSTPDDGDPLPF